MGKQFFIAKSPSAIGSKLGDYLNTILAQGPVLWLVSGGSAIKVAIEAAQRLNPAVLDRLTISLVDERYGGRGHSDSNWNQLLGAGFAAPGSEMHPVLTGEDAAKTVKGFMDFLGAHAQDYKFALLGMGADGHTAGILPNSPAIDEPGLVSYYQGPDYRRITLSQAGLKFLDEAWLYAVGDNKRQALQDLMVDKPISQQPAQIIKQIRRWSVYNDLEGEAI